MFHENERASFNTNFSLVDSADSPNQICLFTKNRNLTFVCIFPGLLAVMGLRGASGKRSCSCRTREGGRPWSWEREVGRCLHLFSCKQRREERRGEKEPPGLWDTEGTSGRGSGPSLSEVGYKGQGTREALRRAAYEEGAGREDWFERCSPSHAVRKMQMKQQRDTAISLATGTAKSGPPTTAGAGGRERLESRSPRWACAMGGRFGRRFGGVLQN